MKYLKIFTIDGQRFPLISDAVTLDLFAPGRAIFTVKSDTPVQDGTVRLSVALGEKTAAKAYFTGYIETCVHIDAKQIRLICRELTFLLAVRVPLAMRNCTLADVIDAVSAKTGLDVKMIEKPWTNIRKAYFFNEKTGNAAIDLVAAESGEKLFICQADPKGVIVVGPNPEGQIDLPHTFFSEQTVAGAACAFIPGIRPGISVKIGDDNPRLITGTTVTGHGMRIAY